MALYLKMNGEFMKKIILSMLIFLSSCKEIDILKPKTVLPTDQKIPSVGIALFQAKESILDLEKHLYSVNSNGEVSKVLKPNGESFVSNGWFNKMVVKSGVIFEHYNGEDGQEVFWTDGKVSKLLLNQDESRVNFGYQTGYEIVESNFSIICSSQGVHVWNDSEKTLTLLEENPLQDSSCYVKQGKKDAVWAYSKANYSESWFIQSSDLVVKTASLQGSTIGEIETVHQESRSGVLGIEEFANLDQKILYVTYQGSNYGQLTNSLIEYSKDTKENQMLISTEESNEYLNIMFGGKVSKNGQVFIRYEHQYNDEAYDVYYEDSEEVVYSDDFYRDNVFFSYNAQEGLSELSSINLKAPDSLSWLMGEDSLFFIKHKQHYLYEEDYSWTSRELTNYQFEVIDSSFYDSRDNVGIQILTDLSQSIIALEPPKENEEDKQIIKVLILPSASHGLISKEVVSEDSIKGFYIFDFFGKYIINYRKVNVVEETASYIAKILDFNTETYTDIQKQDPEFNGMDR